MATVKQLIESLQQYPTDAEVEIEVNQYNKRYPVAYCELQESTMVEGSFATMRNGQTVRITIGLPHDEEKMMITLTRKF